MKHSSIYLTLFLLGSILFQSCGPNPHAEQIRQIDSLNTQLKALESTLARVDSAKVNERLRIQLENLNFAQSEMDTMPRHHAFLLDKYNQYKKAYSKWGAKIPAFYKERALRLNQLQDLKADMENEARSADTLNNYFSQELENIKLLTNIVNSMEVNLESIEQPYLETHDKVTHLIDSLRNETKG